MIFGRRSAAKPREQASVRVAARNARGRERMGGILAERPMRSSVFWGA
jgi:hypothetical protein